MENSQLARLVNSFIMSRNIVGPRPLLKGRVGGGNGVGRLVLGGYEKFCQKGEITLKRGG